MTSAATAAGAGLVRCGSCDLLLRAKAMPTGGRASCPRCGATIAQRKPGSLSRTWALVIAACVLYVPANVFPVMIVTGPGGSQADTILSGVQSMFAMGWYVVGGLIFFASITVPVLKLTILISLLVSVERRTRWRPRDRTVLYRVVEVVGRWSMLDMFVVSLTVALVQLGAVANVEPGIGATFFAGVVVLTIFAAASFDPRLIWDAMEEER
jgi:paraquat-inducible protein A